MSIVILYKNEIKFSFKKSIDKMKWKSGAKPHLITYLCERLFDKIGWELMKIIVSHYKTQSPFIFLLVIEDYLPLSPPLVSHDRAYFNFHHSINSFPLLYLHYSMDNGICQYFFRKKLGLYQPQSFAHFTSWFSM